MAKPPAPEKQTPQSFLNIVGGYKVYLPAPATKKIVANCVVCVQRVRPCVSSAGSSLRLVFFGALLSLVHDKMMQNAINLKMFSVRISWTIPEVEPEADQFFLELSFSS